MVAETAKKFEALEAQAHDLMSVFIKAGHEAVAPAVIQPADVFLDVIGEALRARTYVFNDPDGDELCLRPDLTVPTCRLHLERHEKPDKKARYCYNGTAFRFQPVGAGAAHPREFRQAGIETIGNFDKEKAEANTLALIIEALRSVGIEDFKLRIGDLGLLRSVLNSADMPERWRQRLLNQFWRPEAFKAELARLTAEPAAAAASLPPELLKNLDPERPQDATKLVAQYLEQQGIETFGARTLAEVAEHLTVIASDAGTEPLSDATSSLIESYIGVTAPARAAGARLKDLMRDQGVDISAALERYHRRLGLLSEAGVDIVRADFSAEFGRTLEYYTGFVFEITVPQLNEKSPIAGGGRYDGLAEACGASQPIPAVGAAIHTERLLAAVTGEG